MSLLTNSPRPRFSTVLLNLFSVAALLFAFSCGRRVSNEFQGYVEGDFVNIAASQPGRLDSLAVIKGQTIASGAALFFLDSEVETAALRQAEQQLAAARAQLEDLQQGRRPQEIDVIKAQLAQAVANDKLAQSTLTRQEEVFRTGGVSPEELEVARARADQASARVEELRNQLKVASLPARSDQVTAQAALVEAAQAAYDQAKWRLDQKVLTARTGGLVYDVIYEVGEWVPVGAPVVRLLPQQQVKIRFFVPESSLSVVTPGREVAVNVDGITNSIPARVSYVSPVAEYTPPIIYSNDTRAKLVYLIEAVPVNPQNFKLNVGQPVTVILQ